MRVLRHLLLAHAAAYRVIRRLDSQAQAGIVHQMRLPEPARPGSRADRAISEVYDFAVNRLGAPRRASTAGCPSRWGSGWRRTGRS